MANYRELFRMDTPAMNMGWICWGMKNGMCITSTRKIRLGSIRQMVATDPTGQVSHVSATTTYDPYGNMILNT